MTETRIYRRHRDTRCRLAVLWFPPDSLGGRASFGPNGVPSGHTKYCEREPIDGKRHFEEGAITILAKTHSLWRVVDQDGSVLDVLAHCKGGKAGFLPGVEHPLHKGLSIRSGTFYHPM